MQNLTFKSNKDGTCTAYINEEATGAIIVPKFSPENEKVISVIGSYCRKITSVCLPDTLKTIEPEAFTYCDSLLKINIPNGVTIIGKKAFYTCESLREIELPDSVTIIDAGAFYNSGLRQIQFNKVTTIGWWAFANTELIELILPDTVTCFEDRLYELSTIKTLKKIRIPNTIQEIEIHMPVFKSDIIEYNEFNDGLYIGNENNPYLILVTNKKNNIIHKNCKIIAAEAFKNNNKIFDINIPNGVTIIGEGAFAQCNELKKVNIPKSVTVISNLAFANCKKLILVEAEEETKRQIGILPFWHCDHLLMSQVKGSETISLAYKKQKQEEDLDVITRLEI